jgi:membrane-associated phospholipid phosphatase
MIVAAAFCAAAFGALLALAYEVGPARWLDAAALDGFASLGDHARIAHAADIAVHAFDPVPFAVMTCAIVVFALLARGARHAAAAGLLLAGANVSSQVLKPLLAHPRDTSGFHHAHELHAQAYPSGHVTAAMSLALAAVLVTPRAWRPLVATVCGVAVLGVSIAVVVLNWHFPSDVVGGQLLATTWCLVALAALRWAGARWPQRGEMARAARGAMVVPGRIAAVVLVLLGIAFAIGLAANRADAVTAYAHDHTAAVAVGVAIATSAMALLAAVTALAARRSGE